MAGAALRVIQPIAGASRRFSDAGIARSKAMLPIGGVPMFIKSLSSLAASPVPCEITVVTRADLPEHASVPALLAEHGVAGAETVSVERLTSGPADTCALGLRMSGFHEEQPLIVLDVDLFFRSEEYWRLVSDARNIDGAVLTFPAREPRYSFVETNESGRVMRIAEKEVISARAVAGAYYFRRTEEFLETAERLRTEGGAGGNELYVSAVIGDMLVRGRSFLAAHCDEYASFGTPDELWPERRPG